LNSLALVFRTVALNLYLDPWTVCVIIIMISRMTYKLYKIRTPVLHVNCPENIRHARTFPQRLDLRSNLVKRGVKITAKQAKSLIEKSLLIIVTCIEIEGPRGK
jgi:hypothetical protein